MSDLTGIKIGFAMTGSFCTFEKAFEQARILKNMGADLIPVMSFNAGTVNSRFGTAKEHIEKIEEICNHKVIMTIEDAEPVGPKKMFDVLTVTPCTGNTLAKLANSITDTPVTMAVKSHLRNMRPVVLTIASNDSLAGSAKNIGVLLNLRNYYFTPFMQDDSEKKPFSVVADYSRLPETIISALEKKQIQPIMVQ